MSMYVVDSEDLVNIADVIRAKGGTSANLEFPNGFVSAVRNLSDKDHTFDVPTIPGTYTYDGTAQTPTVTGFYSDFMTESGDTSETNAGSYSITFALKDTENCQWRDGTTENKTVAWSIAKAALPKPTISADNLALDADNLTKTFTVSRLGDGTITATSSDPTKVTASVSGDTVTVTLVDPTAIGDSVDITITVAEGTNYLAYTASDVVCAISIIDAVPQGYIVFESEDGTSITVGKNGGKTWDGMVEYSTDGSNWSEWDGVSSITGSQVYLRGIGNTVFITSPTNRLTLSGTNIACRGRIDALLDYTETSQGNFPQMNIKAFCGAFYSCTELVTPPAFPSLALASGCYQNVLNSCSKLRKIPVFPATRLAAQCYQYAFYACPSIKLSTVQDSVYKYEYRIPPEGTGTMDSNALGGMFEGTGGSFAGTPTINTTYYTSNEIVS